MAFDYGTTVTGSVPPTMITPQRVANAYTNNMRASGQQAADTRTMRSPFQGRGIGAGSAGANYMQSMQSQKAQAASNNQVSDAKRSAYEGNHAAQLQSAVTQAGENASLGADAQSMNQADWSKGFTTDVAKQTGVQAQQQYLLKAQQAAQNLSGPLINSLVGSKMVGNVLGGLLFRG